MQYGHHAFAADRFEGNAHYYVFKKEENTEPLPNKAPMDTEDVYRDCTYAEWLPLRKPLWLMPADLQGGLTYYKIT
jgi:hypothetical protein